MEELNAFVLRRLNNPDNKGRVEPGQISRERFGMLTITAPTMMGLRDVVKVGKGGYGSPTTELSLRMLLTVLGRMRCDTIGEELALAVRDRQATVRNLRCLADYIEERSDELEAKAEVIEFG